MSADYSAYFEGGFAGQKDTDKVLPRSLLKNPHRKPIPGKPPIEWLTEEEFAYRLTRSSMKTQTAEVYREKTYCYCHPFQYPNIGVELGRVGEYNPDGVELDVPPHGAITIEQDEPIIAVTVIGSACVTPGYVILNAEPLIWQYPRTGVKMKVKNLWGQHVRANMWDRGIDEGWDQAGMSSARFDIPESSKVTIMGGSEHDVGTWLNDETDQVDDDNDAHYNFRIIRVTVHD